MAVQLAPHSLPITQNTSRVFSIEVDPFDVEKLYDLVMFKLAGVNLRQFLVNIAQRYFSYQIALRFAHQGDAKSGAWEPLTDATQDIRKALGYGGAGPINIRTSDLFMFVTEHYDASFGPTWAQLDVPGEATDPVIEQKLRTAQEGTEENVLGYGATPARPVLADDTEEDMQALLEALEGWLMVEVAGALL